MPPDHDTVLDLKLVGDIGGRFYVPAYQRGYRWGTHEVEKLLSDIWDNGDKPYSLQPVVVKRRGDNEWELVDGQQRLTTLYLVFLYMRRAQLQNADPPWSITYETRTRSEAYLRELDESQKADNIDFFHMYNAYACIRDWFEAHGGRRQFAANKFYGYLFEHVRVIWYEAPATLNSRTLFARLNIGRIPLTNAELVKALLLSRSRRTDEPVRAAEVGAQWDLIERDLQDPDLWAFLTNARAEHYPTRIELLLDLLASGPTGRERRRFYTFDYFREQIAATTREQVWERVLDLHALLREWYEDRDLYHKVGFLVAAGERLVDLVATAAGDTKSAFSHLLDRKIRERMALTRSSVHELRFDSPTQKAQCARLLLLMNVETVRRLKDSTERYSFRAHKGQAWTLEHIHAQHAEGLTTVEQWTEWLRQHRDALAELPIEPARRDALLARIDGSFGTLDRQSFTALAGEVTEAFTPTEEREAALQSVHSLSNLALLASDDNSTLGNAVFEVKRRRILALDREGAYIPICTRRVFLKYYTPAGAQQLHFWSAADRAAYLDAMFAPEHGVLSPYLSEDAR